MTPDQIVSRFTIGARSNFVKLRAGISITGAQLNGLKLRRAVLWQDFPSAWVCDPAVCEAFDRRWPKVAPDKPHRVQLRRAAGWRLPGNTITVARPSQWGNPFVVDGVVTDRATAVELYHGHIVYKLIHEPDLLAPLRGKNLACWCPLSGPCHADVLLNLANE